RKAGIILRDMDAAKLNKLGQSLLATPVTLLVIVFVMFGDVLFSPAPLVLSSREADGANLFIPWREFGFGELRQGNLALWNPHIVCGYPFFGGFQSALLYPPNGLYLILPIDKAVNVDIVLHILLAGLFMYAWTWYRGLSPLARLLSAVLLMFGAPFYSHLFAGHLTPLAVMAWAPLVFLACDGLFRRPSLGWCLLGSLAVAMQILAGYPQLVFYTAVAVSLYSVLTVFASIHRARALLGIGAMYLGGAALAGVQLFTGLQAASECVRSQGLSYRIAASFSLPPENLLTLLAPDFFGNITNFPYWGRWYLWEMSLFMSVTGFALALYGALTGDSARDGSARERRPALVSVALVVLLLVLALAASTPLFRFLYDYVPGFNKFRGSSKFIFLALLFLALLAGMGFDSLLRSSRRARPLAIMTFVLGLTAFVASGWIQASAASGHASAWEQYVRDRPTGSYLSPLYQRPDFALQAGVFAATSLRTCGAVCLLLSLLLFLTKRHHRPAAYAIAGLALLEILTWSRLNRPTFDLAAARQSTRGIKQFLRQHPGDYRTLTPSLRNTAVFPEAQEIGGYDPSVLRRYVEFMDFTQGQNPDMADAYLTLSRHHRLFSMLRCRYIFLPGDDRDATWHMAERRDDLPHLLLLHDYRVIQGRDAIFAAMDKPAFDPRRQVILESVPEPRPEKAKYSGAAKIVDSSTDHLTIVAEVLRPAILLITDNYSEGWRAMALPDSVQQQYQVLRANYILRAIPLGAGRHHLRVEYSPAAFRLGIVVSAVSLFLYLTLLGWHLRARSIGNRRSGASMGARPASSTLAAGVPSEDATTGISGGRKAQ
ncbi:MAG: hypothetical protein M3347_10245, partial [Armatimonadota bacterium]|nr:hypothetical protein [Armatimonadota bacterium]